MSPSRTKILQKLRDLLQKVNGERDYIDGSTVEPPEEWSAAPIAREYIPREQPGISIEEGAIEVATAQLVVLLLCGKCQRQHWEPAEEYEPTNLYVCADCQAVNFRPRLGWAPIKKPLPSGER